MSTLSTSLYGSSTNKGIGGMLSGLDTDELVKQMTARTRNKINRQYQSKQKLLYRQEAYREVSKKLLTFSDKYFSYSSGSKMNALSPSFFKSNTIESSSKYVSASGNAENIKNFSISEISSVATAASFASNKTVSNLSFSTDLFKTDKTFSEEEMTFEFNGVKKTIDLSGNYNAKGFAAYLKDQLDKAYGTGMVNVTDTGDYGMVTFSTKNTTDIFGVSGISKELSSFTKIEAGTYNRVNKTAEIMKAGKAGIVGLVPPTDTYKITVNDVPFEFASTDSVTDIMNEINNNAEAGVKISYSSTTDTFTAKSTETGSNKGVTIKDVDGSGNLAEALFGTGVDLSDKLVTGEYIKIEEGVRKIYKSDGVNEVNIGTASYDDENKEYSIDYTDGRLDAQIKGFANYIINKGTDTIMKYTLNGAETTVTRSTTSFSIDGINLNLNEKAAEPIVAGTPITFNVINNTDEVVENVKQLIKDYNEIISLISTKTSEKPKKDYQPLTPEQSDEMEKEEIEKWDIEAKKGMIFGDFKMNNVLRNLKGAMSGKTSVSGLTLADIGISPASMDTSGKLVFNEETFTKKLAQNSDEVVNLFTESTTVAGSISGISVQVQSILKENVGTFGGSGILVSEAGLDNSITSDKNYISKRMEDYDKKMVDLKKDLKAERERYWKKFSSLEQALSNLNAQSSWLTDALG